MYYAYMAAVCLGVPATVSALRRTKIGEFTLEEAKKLVHFEYRNKKRRSL